MWPAPESAVPARSPRPGPARGRAAACRHPGQGSDPGVRARPPAPPQAPSPKPQAPGLAASLSRCLETHVVSVSSRAGISVPDSRALPGPRPHRHPQEGPPRSPTPPLVIRGPRRPLCPGRPSSPLPRPPPHLEPECAPTLAEPDCARAPATAARLPPRSCSVSSRLSGMGGGQGVRGAGGREGRGRVEMKL